MSQDTLKLITSTGQSRIDAMLEAVVGRFEQAFPNQVTGYYVTGSWCNDAALFNPVDPTNSSDVDLHAIFRDRLSPSEQERFWQVLGDCQRISPVPLEVHTPSEQDLDGYWDVALKQRGLLVYGADIRDKIVLPSLEHHLQRAMTYPPYPMALVRGQELSIQQEPHLEYPLTYPDPDHPFYGYTEPAGYIVPATGPTTGAIVSTATWAATILLAVQAQCIVGTKRDAVEKHQQIIGDDWSTLISEVFTQCKLNWHHRIPEDAVAQAHLRELCERMLDLENHLLELYQPYLVQWLGQEENRDFALRLLSMIRYPDFATQVSSGQKQ
jgi:hypothetical protein